jgi:methyl-accepting chemotaxis protein
VPLRARPRSTPALPIERVAPTPGKDKKKMPRPPVFRLDVSKKLALVFAGAVAVTAGVMGWSACDTAQRMLVESAQRELADLAHGRHDALLAHLDASRTSLELMAHDPMLAMNLDALEEAVDLLGEQATAKLQAAYIDLNPFPAGEREKYDGPGDGTSFAMAHARANRVLRSAAAVNGWYDVLLIDREGRIVYTAEKERDFAADLRRGSLRDTSLAALFQKLEQEASGTRAALSDMRRYEPSGGRGLFLGAPVLDAQGRFAGALVARLDTDALDRLLDARLSPDERVLLVDREGLLWNQPGTITSYEPLETRIDDEGVRQALRGEENQGRLVGKDGAELIRLSMPVDHLGQKLVLAVATKLDAIEAPAEALATKLLGITALVAALLGLAAFVLGRAFARPIVQMAGAVRRLAAGEQAPIPGLARTDEIGDLARSLAAIHHTGLEALQIRAALDNSEAQVMVADAGGTIIYANASMIRLLELMAPDLRKTIPDFAAGTIVGRHIDEFHKEPSRQHAILSRLEGRHATTLHIGERMLNFVYTPVHDAHGRRVATVTEWLDLTDWIRAEQEVAAVVARAAEGDFSGRLSIDGKSDGMASVAQGLNQVSAMMESAVAEFADTLDQLARGDLSGRITGEHRGIFGTFKRSLNETLDRLGATVAAIQATATEIKTAASEINAGADDLARRNEQQASSLEETARNTRELAGSVEHGAQRSAEANRLAQEARQLAERGRAVVAEAVAAMQKIEQASVRTGDITVIIQEIASETKLLAFNAEVEAEHAGEKGRGFAVVAQEVGTLADRSRDAAKDIKSLIETNNREIKDGVALFKSAGEALEQIFHKSQQVDERIAEISTAAKEQAHGIKEMSQAIAHMDGITQSNAGLAEESAASSRSLAERIADLQRQIDFFKLGGAAARPTAAAVFDLDGIFPAKANGHFQSSGHANGHAGSFVSQQGWTEH